MNIAICEDDLAQRQYLEALVSQWSQRGKIGCRVDCYQSAEQLYFSFDEKFPYDLYILDIQMGKMNGMELARKIRERDETASILFLTGLREYAIEGYEVGAVRYLVKPLKEDELLQILQDIYDRKKEEQQETYFILEKHDEIVKIPYRDIWYLEAQGHYVELVYQEKRIRWKEVFGRLQQEFEKNGFVMTRRGVLVNMARIARVGKTACVLDNGETVLISRSQYKKVNEAFISYYRGMRGEG